MNEQEKLLELLAGLELALYRERQADVPLYRLEKVLEEKISQTKERLRVILYGTSEP